MHQLAVMRALWVAIAREFAAVLRASSVVLGVRSREHDQDGQGDKERKLHFGKVMFSFCF